MTIANSGWVPHTDYLIKELGTSAVSTQRKKWVEIAKIVAYCVGLVLLAGLAAGLLAPTPYAMVLAPLSALFVVYCILPAARIVKEAVWAIRRLNQAENAHRTTMEQLKTCKKTFEEEALFHRFADAHCPAAPTPRALLEAHKRYQEFSHIHEVEFPPEAQL